MKESDLILIRKKSLAECAAGDVVGFSYGRKNNSVGLGRRLGKVVSVRDIRKQPLSPGTVRSNPIERSRFLVTVEDGPEKYRQFYAEDVAKWAVRYTWLGRILNKWVRKVSLSGSWL